MASKVIIDIIANDKASGVTSGIASSLSKIGVALAAVAAAGAAAFLALGKQALDATAEYEQLTLTMESLVARELKAADSTLSMSDALAQATPRAKELLDWIQKLAIQSPFDQQGVADAYRTALAYGFTSDAAQRLTQNMIDFAAGTGQSVAVMNQVALALGQVRARGKLTGQEILQLVNAGVSVTPILEEMGYTLDDVSKGLVSADEFLEAFNQTMEEDFTGAAKRATNSWSGLLSSLGDIKKIGLRTLFADTFAVLQPLVAKFAEWLQSDEGITKLKEIGARMGEITQSIVDMASALSGMSLSDIVSAIGDGAVALTEGFKQWAQGIDWNKISNELSDGIASIDWAGLGEQVRVAATNIFEGIKEAAEETDWQAMFKSASDAFMEFMAGLTNQGTWENVKSTWRSNFLQLSQIIYQSMNIMKAAASDGMVLLSASVGAIVWQMVLTVEDMLNQLKQAFWGKFNDMIDAAKNTLYSRAEEIYVAMQELFDLAKSAMEALVINLSTPDFDAIKEKVRSGLSDIMNAAKGIIKPWVLQLIQPFWEDIITKVAEGAKRVYEAGKKALKSIGLNVSLPDWEDLVRRIEEGMAMLNGAMKGGSAGAKVGGGKGGGSGGKKAMGGRIEEGKATLVGERGPEMFIPDTGGKILPNYKLGGGGNAVVNVNLTYAPLFSAVDQYELQERLAPFIEKGIRNVQRGTA